MKTGQISSLYYSWITIVVINKYGQTEYTIEYAPIDPTSLQMENDTNNQSSSTSLNIDTFSASKETRLMRIDGSLVYEGQDNNINKLELERGVYIKQEFINNEIFKTSKILVP